MGAQEPAVTGASPLLERADRLAVRLHPFQSALAHLAQGKAEDLSRRLRILLFLLTNNNVGRDELLAATDSTSPYELQELYRLGLIRSRRSGFSLTDKGVHILTILLFFDVEVQGALSEGWSGQLLEAVLAGNLDAGTMARMATGTAERMADDLEDVTSTRDLGMLDEAKTMRKRSIDHMDVILGRLRGKIDGEIEDQLTEGATRLQRSYWSQEAAHVALWRQDVRYGHGYNHSNITKRFSQHNLKSLVNLMDQSKAHPRRFPRLDRKPTLDGVAKILQRPMEIAEMNIDDVVILSAKNTPPQVAAHFQVLMESLDAARDGEPLHKVAGTSTIYFAGIAIAILQYHPLRVQWQNYEFKVHAGKRVFNEGRYVDVPLITIHRRSP